ncbi:SMC-Scp complex subunit ScpB [Rhodococcus kronopolitis]|uniref:SMC-Scp complex subunit ScpB n=1 Tax=Rhodococcus kronopolitis TaxID=1460226 RepID=A0ABV9FTT9_9NOCA
MSGVDQVSELGDTELPGGQFLDADGGVRHVEDADLEDSDLAEADIDDRLSDDELDAALEAVLLVVDSPASDAALASAVGDRPHRVRKRLRAMAAALTDRRSGIDLRYAGEGWRFYTRQEYAPYVERLLLDGARAKLTRAALETLAVVAYRQPLTRARVSAVRGVNVDGVMRTLLARGLVSEAGVDSETKATTYATTELFLERLGLASLADLPALAPLLPDVDVIDDISDDMESDPRFTKLGTSRAGSEPDLDPRIDSEE